MKAIEDVQGFIEASVGIRLWFALQICRKSKSLLGDSFSVPDWVKIVPFDNYLDHLHQNVCVWRKFNRINRKISDCLDTEIQNPDIAHRPPKAKDVQEKNNYTTQE